MTSIDTIRDQIQDLTDEEVRNLLGAVALDRGIFVEVVDKERVRSATQFITGTVSKEHRDMVEDLEQSITDSAMMNHHVAMSLGSRMDSAVEDIVDETVDTVFEMLGVHEDFDSNETPALTVRLWTVVPVIAWVADDESLADLYNWGKAQVGRSIGDVMDLEESADRYLDRDEEMEDELIIKSFEIIATNPSDSRVLYSFCPNDFDTATAVS